jgi:MYXO-CTERM domain-containing protein
MRLGTLLLAAIGTFGITLSAEAQTTAQNLAKYEKLRTRLKDEFVRIGDAPGKGQPAEERDDQEGFIRWADSTIRLGWYIGVLATEYELYTHPLLYPGAGLIKSPDDTLNELYFALRAMERIDEVADVSFPPPCTQAPALNGFFLRDDVPAEFFQEFPPLTFVRSDFVDPELTNKEMSQDQVYHVLIGLALVKKFIPESATSNGKSLNSWAVEQAQRIMQHVSEDAWVIRNPACDNREVNRGPLALGFSGGSRLAIGFITDGAFVPETTDTAIEIWDLARETFYAPYFDIDNVHMGLAIASVSNGWGDATAEAIHELAKEPDWPAYPLLHRALHGDGAGGWCKTGEEVNSHAKQMLDELPTEAEIASPAPATASHGWTLPHRFLRAKSMTGEAGSEGLRFPGLDYMLLHNLYAIVTPATWNGSTGPGIPECSLTPDPDGGPGASAEADDDSGCGCRVAGDSGLRAPVWLGLLALVPLLRRRR